MPRSRSRSMESSSCARIARGSTVCVSSRIRSASVDLPWSMWAMIEKLRMCAWSATEKRLGPLDARAEQVEDLARLGDAQREHGGDVRGGAGGQRHADGDDLGQERAAERGIEAAPDAVGHAAEQRRGGDHAGDGAERLPELQAVEAHAQR